MAGSFGNLLEQAGLAASPEGDAQPAAKAVATQEPIAYGPKIVVRHERKGHSGKTITRISGVVSGHEALSRLLKKQLAIGVRVDGETLILQGDQRERAARWLESQGAAVQRAWR
jgi:translation initiation factor 1